MRDGFGPAMAKFIGLTSINGPVPAEFADRPARNPAEFGLPTEDDGTRDDPLLGQNIASGDDYELDFDALRAASARIVLAAGAESEGELTHRAALAVAERLGRTPSSSPATTPVSSPASSACRATRTLRQVLTEDG